MAHTKEITKMAKDKGLVPTSGVMAATTRENGGMIKQTGEGNSTMLMGQFMKG